MFLAVVAGGGRGGGGGGGGVGVRGGDLTRWLLMLSLPASIID